jgi:hypothetical protein
LANSQDRVKLEAQDHSYQHLRCTSHSLQLGIVNWLRKEIGKIDQKSRKLVTIEEIHHLKADGSRLYIKRQNCGLD